METGPVLALGKQKARFDWDGEKREGETPWVWWVRVLEEEEEDSCCFLGETERADRESLVRDAVVDMVNTIVEEDISSSFSSSSVTSMLYRPPAHTI